MDTCNRVAECDGSARVPAPSVSSRVLMHALTLHLVLIAVLGSAQRLAAPAQYFREPWRDSAHAQLRVGGDIMQQPNGRLDFAPQPAAVRRRPPAAEAPAGGGRGGRPAAATGSGQGAGEP